MTLFIVAKDVLKEAVARKWIIATMIFSTLFLMGVIFFLKLDVVDGVMASMRLFGDEVSKDIKSLDHILLNIYRYTSIAIFYMVLIMGALFFGDFAPKLLEPGRIEFMISLPIKRWQLLLGSYLGVIALIFLFILYLTGGITVIFGLKTGFWSMKAIESGILALFAFVPLYGVMVLSALFVRSAPFSIVMAYLFTIFASVASHKSSLLKLFEKGLFREVFGWLISLFPPIFRLPELINKMGGSFTIWSMEYGKIFFSIFTFTSALLFIAFYKFQKEDY